MPSSPRTQPSSPRTQTSRPTLPPATMLRLPATVVFAALLLALTFSSAEAQAPPSEPDRVMAFGDSISIGLREPGVRCDDPIATAKGYGPHLETALAERGRSVEVLPRGICGELTSQGLSRIAGELAAAPSEVVILMEGTNDISSGNPPIGVESMRRNLRDMAKRADEAGTQAVYSSVIPYGPGAGSQSSRNATASLLSDILETQARREWRAFADPYDDLLAVPGLFEDFYASDGFHLVAEGYELLAQSFVEPTERALDDRCEPAPCVADATTLCLQKERFRTEVMWIVGDPADGGSTGAGQVQPVSADTGKVYFFSPDNTELVIKVLDGRCLSDHFWVFFGALSDVEYQVRLTDTETCERRVYANPKGTFASRGDTEAFPAAAPDDCPAESVFP